MIKPVLLLIASDEHTHSALIMFLCVCKIARLNFYDFIFRFSWWVVFDEQLRHVPSYLVSFFMLLQLQLHEGLLVPYVAFHAVILTLVLC